MTGESKEQKSQRRARLQLSCQPCRIGKLKCNRELPCEQCSKRSRETSCVYTAGAQESISFKAQAKAMREKLENLERAVQHFQEADQRRAEEAGQLGMPGGISALSLASDPSESRLLVPSSSKHDASLTPGHLISSNEEGKAYVGPSHWQSIMNDIAEVKTYFEFESSHEGNINSPEGSQTAATSPAPSNAPDLFLRISPSITRETLLYSIPQRHVADRLVSTYLGSMDPYQNLIHLPTFQTQYQQFWQQPETAPMAWIAFLFTIFALGFQYTIQSNSEKEPIYDSNTYLELAAHAIALADYTRPKAYTIEGLMLYIRCSQIQDPERPFKEWLSLGLVSRICIRMGYHRDPSHYPEISPFEGEMRRRVWTSVCFLDVTMSYQVGLLSNITNLYSDVRLPRNLHDSDFGPNSAELPPSRPPTDLTAMSHDVHVARIIPIFAEAIRLSHSPVAPNIQSVYAIASRLQQVADEIPPPLMIVSPEQCLTDSPSMILKRFGMDILVQKARCVLFRRYLGTSEHKARKICVEAALRTLAIQKALEDARLPGGPLNNCPLHQLWCVMDSFLLAGIIVALEISAVQRKTSEQDLVLYSKEQFQAMVHMLQDSCDIWHASNASEKTKRAAKALEAVLRPRNNLANLASSQEFSGGDLLDASQLHVSEADSQWIKASENPLQAFDVNGLAPEQIAPYLPATSSPPMQMDFPLQPPMNIDWVSSRLPYFG